MPHAGYEADGMRRSGAVPSNKIKGNVYSSEPVDQGPTTVTTRGVGRRIGFCPPSDGTDHDGDDESAFAEEARTEASSFPQPEFEVTDATRGCGQARTTPPTPRRKGTVPPMRGSPAAQIKPANPSAMDGVESLHEILKQTYEQKSISLPGSPVSEMVIVNRPMAGISDGLDDLLPRLVHLNSLTISRTGLRELPPELFSALDRLEVLNLSKNELLSLPNEMGCMRSLQELDVSCNQLKALPDTLTSCELLQVLRCERNEMLKLPDRIDRWTLMHTLVAAHNRLLKLPEQICKLSLLETIDVSKCQLRLPSQQVCDQGLSAILHFFARVREQRRSIDSVVSFLNNSCHSPAIGDSPQIGCGGDGSTIDLHDSSIIFGRSFEENHADLHAVETTAAQQSYLLSHADSFRVSQSGSVWLASGVSVEISQFRKTNGSPFLCSCGHTRYILRMTLGSYTYEVSRRFTDFLNLHRALRRRTKELVQSEDLRMCPKKVASWRSAVIEKRMSQLELYIHRVLQLVSTKSGLPHEVFIELERFFNISPILTHMLATEPATLINGATY